MMLRGISRHLRRRLRRFIGAGRCVLTHPASWKRMEKGANGVCWYCRRCGRTWSFIWR